MSSKIVELLFRLFPDFRRSIRERSKIRSVHKNSLQRFKIDRNAIANFEEIDESTLGYITENYHFRLVQRIKQYGIEQEDSHYHIPNEERQKQIRSDLKKVIILITLRNLLSYFFWLLYIFIAAILIWQSGSSVIQFVESSVNFDVLSQALIL